MDSEEAKGAASVYPPEPEAGDIEPDGTFSLRFEQRIREFLEGRVVYTHPNRIRRYEVSRLSDFYRMSQQWKRKLRTGRAAITRYRDLAFDPNDPRSIPVPVLNIVEDKIRNEAARLSQPDYQPYVPVSGVDPDIDTREGAKLAVQALEHCLRETNWPLQLTLGTNHMPQYGGWWLKSYWDTTFEETTTVGVQGAVQCSNPSCDFKLASPEVSAPQAQGLAALSQQGGAGGAAIAQTGPGAYSVQSCPQCPPQLQQPAEPPPAYGAPEGLQQPQDPALAPTAPVPLQPFSPIGSELSQKDPFGRPFGQDVPVGKWKLETRSDYDMWVEHDGIEVQPGGWEEIAEVYPVNIEYVRNRYAAGFDVEPESDAAMRKFNPISFADFGYMAPGTPNRRVRLWEFYKKPWRIREKDPVTGSWTTRMNKGRVIHYANGKLLKFDDLMEVGTTGESFPTTKYIYIPHEIRSGGKELHGVSLFEGLLKAQDSTNRMMSMIEDTLYRQGVPSYLITKAMTFAWEASGRAGRRVVWEPDDRYPTMKPEPIGNTEINPSLLEVVQKYADYASAHSADREVEQGGPDTGGDAAAAIQLKLENAGAQRAQRHLRVREGLKEGFSHGLILLSNKVVEPRSLWREDNPGKFQQRIWEGKDLHDQTRVEIDSSPVYDSDIVQMINLKSAADMGTIQAQNPRTARLINRRLHIPNELLTSENLQTDLAEREFKDLLERGVWPRIDPVLDHDAAHLEQHTEDLHSEPWIDLELKAGIPQLMGALEDWDTPRPFTPPQPGQPPSPLPPPWVGILPPPPPMPQMPGMPPTPPPPPSGPVPIMEDKLKQGDPGNPMMGVPSTPPMPALADRILKYWSMLIPAAGLQMPQQGTPGYQALYARAHIEAHRLRLETVAQQSMAGQATAAAPGAPSTMGGMAPGQGANAGPVDPSSMQPQ